MAKNKIVFFIISIVILFSRKVTPFPLNHQKTSEKLKTVVLNENK